MWFVLWKAKPAKLPQNVIDEACVWTVGRKWILKREKKHFGKRKRKVEQAAVHKLTFRSSGVTSNNVNNYI